MSRETTMGDWRVGDVVQIDPEHDEVFGGAFMVVNEVKRWGAQGYFEIPGEGHAYYRVAFGNAERVGRATWVGASVVDTEQGAG